MTNRKHGRALRLALLASITSLTAGLAQADTWVPVHGGAHTADGTPVCAMVLANGQYMFSCGGAGAYSLDVPLDAQGQITLFVFADGFAPYRATTGPGNYPLAVQMLTASAGAPLINMSRSVECSAFPNRAHISGTIDSAAGEPLCAMVLSNGEHMFSCDASLGQYDLDVPVDPNGQVTVFGFADGFQPYRNTFTAPECEEPVGPDGIVEGGVSLHRQVGTSSIYVTASGGFSEKIPPPDPPEGYPELGECRFNVLPHLDPGDIGFYTPRSFDAGPALQLVRGDGQALTLARQYSLLEDISIAYYPEGGISVDPEFYRGGQSYVFSGSGGPNVGPFETPPVVAPPALDLVSPAESAPPYILHHNADQPLQLVWNGNNGVGEVEILLDGIGSAAGYRIWCRFIDDGHAEIPSALLAQVRDGLKKDPSVLPSSPFFMKRETFQRFESPGLELHVWIETSATVSVHLE